MGKKKKKNKDSGNIIALNKKASFEYILLDRFEAGLVLTGSEVKSLRENKANLSDSYALEKGGELYLVNSHISEYKFANQLNHEPKRERKLLLHKGEIGKLTAELREKGLTIVPTKLYWKNGKAKVEIALAKGKRLFDKRDTIKRRESDRAIRRSLKNR